MAVHIRLARHGTKKAPFFRIVVTDHRNPRDGRHLENIGTFHPAAEGVLNRLEAGIRAFDPCLSCSTHAVGQMPLMLEVVDSAGRLISRTEREGL